MPATNNRKGGKKMDLSHDIEEVVRPRKNESRQELVIPQESSSFAKIAFTFIGLAIILILGVFYFSYFYTTLIITPNKQEIKTDFEVQVVMTEAIRQEVGDLGEVAAMLGKWAEGNPDKLSGEVLETNVLGEKKFAVVSEGGEEKPGTAHGKIKVFNTQNVNQALVAKTRFQSEGGVIFRIRQAVTVPAKGELEVEVFADEEGVGGNVGPSKFILPGFTNEAKRKAVYAESYAATTGGVIREKVLTQEDINSAKEKLEGELKEQALLKLDEELKKNLGASQQLPTQESTETEDLAANNLSLTYEKILPQAVLYEITAVTIEPEIGTKTSEFTLKMGVLAQAILFDEQGLLALANLKMKDNLTEGRELTNVNEESLTYKVKKYEKDLGIAVLEVSMTGEGYVTSPELLGKLELKSLEPEDIQTYLEAHPEIANIEIKEAPIWMRKLPILKDRVRVKVVLPE